MSLSLIVGTLNINGSYSDLKKCMLNTFIKQQHLDIVFLQEVVSEEMCNLPNYNYICNIGSNGRGTAILYHNALVLQDTKMLPDGRGISAKYEDTLLINVYAPSGSQNRQARQQFFNSDVTFLFLNWTGKAILGGDFNSVQNQRDCTGTIQKCSALDYMISSMQFHDVWELAKHPPIFTYFCHNAASRIDRIYVSNELKQLLPQRPSIECLPAAFTDHSMVLCYIRLPNHPATIHRGRSFWKLNMAYITSASIVEDFRIEWQRILQHKVRFSNILEWWVRYAKLNLKRFFI